MNDEEIAPGDFSFDGIDGGKNLLMNPAIESQVRAIAKQLDVRHGCHVELTVVSSTGAMDADEGL